LTTRALVAGMLLTLTGLTGCSSTTDSYCDALEDQKQTLTGLAGSSAEPGTDLFGDTLKVFQDLRDEAPDDIRDEWDTFVFAWEGVADAFDDAGIDPQQYQPGTPPPGVSAEQARAIEQAAAELRSDRVVDAGTGIEQHARDVCKVDLGL
jgi:hypothetical protein